MVVNGVLLGVGVELVLKTLPGGQKASAEIWSLRAINEPITTSDPIDIKISPCFRVISDEQSEILG